MTSVLIQSAVCLGRVRSPKRVKRIMGIELYRIVGFSLAVALVRCNCQWSSVVVCYVVADYQGNIWLAFRHSSILGA